MKTLKYILLPILFLSASCYIYRPYVEKEEKVNSGASALPSAGSLSLMDNDKATKQKTTLNPEAAREQDEKEKMKQQKKQEQEEAEKKKRENVGKSDENGRVSKNMEFSPAANTNLESPRKGKQDINSTDSPEPQIVEKGIRGKLQPNKFYKITAREKQFKIQVDKWDGDSLVAHIIRKPQKQVKFHKDEINEELILERRFSRPFSDLFTVGAYAAGAAAVLLIVL